MASAPLPHITPMAPTFVAQPFHRAGWVYEEKVDGWRMLAYKVARTVRLVSRNGRDHTSRFPGIVAALRKLDATGLILEVSAVRDLLAPALARPKPGGDRVGERPRPS
jgi:bifunctional non-homologous end joining protein LigD